MLENILNNVNASNEVQAPSKKASNTKIKDTDKKEIDFKDILEKNLKTDKETTNDITNSIKDKNPLLGVEDKNTQTKNSTKPDKKDKEIISNTKDKNLPSNTTDKIIALNTHDVQKNDDTNTPTEDIKSPNEKILSQTQIKPQTEKKISDIKTLSDEKKLSAKNINIEQHPEKIDNKSIPNPPKQQMTQDILEQKSKTPPTTSNQKPEEKPLTFALKTLDEIDKKELKERKKFNQEHKIEYKTEGKDEKIAIIERGTQLPKNIVAPKIYQEKREAKLQANQEKNQTLQEAISQSFVKEIKDPTQKKTKKSTPEGKSNSTGTALTVATLAQKLQEQNKQFENENTIEKNNTQTSLLEKTKKKDNNQEVRKAKEKVKETPLKEKDSPTTLGIDVKNDLLYKNNSAKETIKNFVQNFKEEIKNYKPPMTKISLELHPEKLGKLELTIKQVGKNLQVNVISNNQAMALFVQNQTELRQNLAMIGFNGVDLNFSSSQENPQKNNQDSSNQKRNKNSLKQYEEIKNIPQIPYDTMEIILPKYA
ncbi:flagellar hook-length control protein FliK [Helicobacter sp. 13S00477-4]|uniref:flagellar hook-length control protein FliK n=1 Tax=Helicobacter sp. 13S00477-4 TaxID=1905759 RepID=UPI000BA6FCAF|nr:flagellar hook-length control protein FliK [Helicobacter sp. 13S00477-4]PAF52079.1 hypothetical protein BKH44_04200 [Helicobacter sp. 13S00477-4]